MKLYVIYNMIITICIWNIDKIGRKRYHIGWKEVSTVREFMGYRIFEFDTIESTNTYLFERAKLGEADKTVVIAKHQTGGRGRRGKSFYSPDSTGLYMSVLVRKGVSLDELGFLTPAIAVAVVHAIERVSQKKCGIKWVNDIFIDDKKVAGILVETKCDFACNALEYAVIGIGINIAEPKGGFPEDIKNTAAAVFDEVDDVKRITLTHELLFELDKILEPFQPKRFMTEYKAKSVLDGRQVEIVTPNGITQARAIGIDDNARLVVETPNGRQALSSGEVSVKYRPAGE